MHAILSAKGKMLDEIQYPDTPFELKHHLTLLVRRGSEAHGTYRPPEEPDAIDDRDLYGVVVPPLGYYFGLKQWEHAEAIKGCWDVVLDEARKWVSLLCRQNPNVLTTLWARDEDYLILNGFGREVVRNRTLFQCREAAFNSFVGYANGQLKRMTSFGQFKGYMGEKRKRLVEKHGFDTKNAAHLIRIMRMGIEYLNTGVLNVWRPDHEELVAIKKGELPLAEILRMSALLYQEAYEARENSVLPEELDMEAINQIVVDGLWAELV